MNNVQIRFIPTDCSMFWITFIAIFKEHTQRLDTECSSIAHTTLLQYTELSADVEKKMLGCRRINLL